MRLWLFLECAKFHGSRAIVGPIFFLVGVSWAQNFPRGYFTDVDTSNTSNSTV